MLDMICTRRNVFAKQRRKVIATARVFVICYGAPFS